MKKNFVMLFAICSLFIGLSFNNKAIAVDFDNLTLVNMNDSVFSNQNEFGHHLFSEILLEKAKDTENVFISPPSAYLALAMLLEGAEGTTREVLLDGLKWGGINRDSNMYRHYVQAISEAHQHFLKTMQGMNSDALTLTLANSLWSELTLPVQSTYVEALKNYYDAQVTNVDFDNDPGNAASMINSWAATSTNNRIPVIISEDMIKRNQLKMLLASAIYFKGTWDREFDKDATVTIDDYFTKTDGTKVAADVMHDRSGMSYYHDAQTEAQVLELPFEGGTSSFYIALPPFDANAKEWVAQNAMDENFWNNVDDMSFEEDVILELPKFKFQTAKTLNDNLVQLGMGEIFNGADFSGISDENLVVSYVKQDAFVQVDEEGAEAAAITSIGIRIESVSIVPRRVIHFQVNRPFLMAIRDKETGTFLFYGLIEDPVWE